MKNQVDDAISEYVHDRCALTRTNLDKALLGAEFFVPLGSPIKELQPGRFDVPVLCVRTDSGEGAMPIFSTLEHLREWKPQEIKYAKLTGRKLLAMALGMPDVSEIVVNLAGTPRGSIPRSDFERMLALK